MEIQQAKSENSLTQLSPIKTYPSFNFKSSEFLSAICHELKTPLSAIIAFSDILKDELKTPASIEECRDYVKEINIAAHDLFDMVHDLLDVQKVETGTFSVDLNQLIDIRDVLRRAVRLTHDHALKRNISLKTEIAEDVGLVRLDNKRMKQILTNLISNAIKYSSRNSEVKITISKNNSEKSLKITVADNGPGMNETQVQTAFVKYKTIANQNAEAIDSFGFGLPIVKHLVELQNGKISIESEVTKGTKVKLKFNCYGSVS